MRHAVARGLSGSNYEKFESLQPEYKPATGLLARARIVSLLDGNSTTSTRILDLGKSPGK